MPPTYSFTFDDEAYTVTVQFVDSKKSIDMAESLAQIGHFERRTWARVLINKMVETNKSVWSFISNVSWGKCPFGERLVVEKWNEPVAYLMHTNTHRLLYIYRLYFTFTRYYIYLIFIFS